jgi:hypothetical protein
MADYVTYVAAQRSSVNEPDMTRYVAPQRAVSNHVAEQTAKTTESDTPRHDPPSGIRGNIPGTGEKQAEVILPTLRRTRQNKFRQLVEDAYARILISQFVDS